MREEVSRILATRFALTTVGDGQQALDAARADPPDVVLVDADATRPDGVPVSDAVWADPQFNDLPVVFLSPSGAEPPIEGLEEGAYDYVVGPFTPRELVARVSAYVRRARAEKALRASEEKYRALFNQMDEAYAVVEVMRDEAGRWSDFLFLDANRAFTTHAGMPYPVGRTATELLGAPNPRWAELYGRVAETGEAIRVEETEFTLGRAFDLNVFRLGGPGSRRVAVLFTDITDRKREEERLSQRTAEATAELRSLSHRILRIQEEERQYLARELHDEIGQALTALQLQLAFLEREPRALDEARATVRELTSRISGLSVDLRPPSLDTLGLLPAVLGQVKRLERASQVRITVHHEQLDRRFPPEIEIAAYRIVQEALTNVVRHARVDEAWVHLVADDASLVIVVRDEGIGFDAAAVDVTRGLGGMRERVSLVEGTLSIDTLPGAGTAITAEFPVGGD